MVLADTIHRRIYQDMDGPGIMKDIYRPKKVKNISNKKGKRNSNFKDDFSSDSGNGDFGQIFKVGDDSENLVARKKYSK